MSKAGNKPSSQTEPTEELLRSNKVTAYWEGEGVAIGQFYKTHDKIKTVKSTDEAVVAAGFQFPTGTEEEPTSAMQKLEAFKTFIMTNAAVFGIVYDPVDRRADEFKFPSRYNEENIAEWAKKSLEAAIGSATEKVQNNVVANMIKSGNLPEGTTVEFGVGDGAVEVTEKYANGFFKYASVEIKVVFKIGERSIGMDAKVDLVSGQLKKPRELGSIALTMTGLKQYFVDNGLLPLIEKKVKEDSDEAGTTEGADATPADTTEPVGAEQ